MGIVEDRMVLVIEVQDSTCSISSAITIYL